MDLQDVETVVALSAGGAAVLLLLTVCCCLASLEPLALATEAPFAA